MQEAFHQKVNMECRKSTENQIIMMMMMMMIISDSDKEGKQE